MLPVPIQTVVYLSSFLYLFHIVLSFALSQMLWARLISSWMALAFLLNFQPFLSETFFNAACIPHVIVHCMMLHINNLMTEWGCNKPLTSAWCFHVIGCWSMWPLPPRFILQHVTGPINSIKSRFWRWKNCLIPYKNINQYIPGGQIPYDGH